MTSLDKKTALSAIRVLAGKGFKQPFFENNKDAVVELIDATKKSEQNEVATATIGFLLDHLSKEKSRLFRDVENRLPLALVIARAYRPEQGVAERLVVATARMGFHGRFPDLPIHLLGRPPSAEEVMFLIDAYVADTACSSASTEEKLQGLARSCLSRADADMQVKRIGKFAEDFHDDFL